MIYLDNGATSFPKPQCVTSEVMRVLEQVGANAGRSGHKMARYASELVFEARETVADFFGIDDLSRVGFTYNTTYAINLLLKGLLRFDDHIVISGMEHNSVLRPIKTMADRGMIEYSIAEADSTGRVTAEAVKRVMRRDTKCICITHVSNVCGTVNDIEGIGAVAQRTGTLFMVDAAQSAGVIPIDVAKMNIDMLAFPGHKALLGVQGTGGFYVGKRCNIKTIIEGGTGSLSELSYQPDLMPDKLESGTMNIAGISALRQGIEYIKRVGIEFIYAQETALAARLIEGLGNINGIKIYGREDNTFRTGTVSFLADGKDCVAVSDYLDNGYNIAVRSGLHCAYLAHKTLGTIETGLVRVSIGCFNKKSDIDTLLYALNAMMK